jgi:hypothetical protein
MSDDRSNSTAHVVDLAKALPNTEQRHNLIDWGATFLSAGTDEDGATRAASLALEIRDLLSRQSRARYQKMSAWQLRLAATAFVVQCVRRKAELAQGDGSNVTH